VEAAGAAQDAGDLQVTGIWSHFACADEPEREENAQQESTFRWALRSVDVHGLSPQVRHLSNSPATLTRPSARFDLVRCGLACYGLSPVPQRSDAAGLGLRPAMTVRGRLAGVKRVDAGVGVSYGHTYTTDRETTLGLVPLGYAEGVPVHASNRAEVAVGGDRAPLVGRVCMDQFVVDLGDRAVSPGDEVVLFGSGDAGEPTAQDWADAAGTISYEIVTRIGGRLTRRWLDSENAQPGGPA
jgi:alanine racemase